MNRSSIDEVMGTLWKIRKELTKIKDNEKKATIYNVNKNE